MGFTVCYFTHKLNLNSTSAHENTTLLMNNSPKSTLTHAISLVGRAKRVPHRAVQSRFRVIYICRYVCRFVYKKYVYAKRRVRNFMAQTHACSKSILGS